jgi:two-component system, OmpR family, response regulator RpaB
MLNRLIGHSQTILIADDEPSIRKVLKTRLSMKGYTVLTAADGQEALDTFHDQSPDLLVLDIMMPKLDGYAVCRTLREESTVPIIMLTALNDVADRITGLGIGADDYMVKPFSPKELEARIDCILRRVKRPTNNDASMAGVIEAGCLRIDTNKRQVHKEGNLVRLTEMEFNILELLGNHLGNAVSRQEILEQVWGISPDTFGRSIDSRVVDVHMSRIRIKIEKDPSDPELVLTVRGDGYRLG